MRLTILLFFSISLWFSSANQHFKHQQNENDYVVNFKTELAVEHFHIKTLNQYIETMLLKDHELLYAAKDSETQMLTLVFSDVHGRLIVNTSGIDQARVGWLCMAGEDFQQVVQQAGFSSISLHTPFRNLKRENVGQKTVKLIQGNVYFPSQQGNSLELRLFLDDKVHKKIVVENPAGSKKPSEDSVGTLKKPQHTKKASNTEKANEQE